MADLKNSYNGKRVLITGGGGFIGSNLAIKLVGLGAEVSIMDSRLPQLGYKSFNLSSIKDKIDIIDKRNGVTYAACIMGWQNMAFDGKPVAFSHDEAAKILADTPWLTDQIGVFIKNRANFM